MKYIYLLLLCGFIMSACQNKTEVQPDDIMSLSLVKDSIIADNVSNAEILARVNMSTSAATRNIKFETNAGTFSNREALYTTTVSLDGKINAYLKYDKAGTATVKVTVNDLYSREIQVHFVARTSPDSIITLEAVKNNQPADNYTYATVVVRSKDPGIINTSREVTFTTDKGLFSNGDKSYTTTTTIDGTATAYIKCSQPDAVIIKATIASAFSRETQLRFIPAFPDYINVEIPGNLKNALDANTIVTALLTRTYGTASAGQRVTFTAQKPSGEVIGTFLNEKASNSNGEASANFWVQDTSYAGIILIKATVVDGANIITGKNQLLITK